MMIRVRLWALAAAMLPMGALAAEFNTLTSIQVSPQRGGTQVVVKGNRPPTFTVFRMADPDRLVVDLSTADAAAIQGHHDGMGPVDGVVVSQFSGSQASVGRVLVALRGAPQYDVRAEGNAVLVTVTGGEAPAAVAAAEPAPAADVAAAPSTGQGETPAPAAEPVVARPAPGPDGVVQVRTDEQQVARPAKVLKGLKSEKGRLRVITDGPLARFDVVELADPPRLAVDLFGVKGPRALAVRHPGVREVRVGGHGEKVRLVFDLEGAMPAWDVARNPRGMDLLL
ncbi:MAG: AMIN domain-containing protein, partial [Deltaproteobacteria bacterium]|nr:AMIN domain-containing protein [Deltaproteobacteria bacterium]